MITRLYIDNYKCFSDFTYEPRHLDLLIGKNGSGKTSIFDLLQDLKRVVTYGESVEDVFMIPSLNAWDQREIQSFELVLSRSDTSYLYRLRIQHDLETNYSKIVEESVSIDEKELYVFDGEKIHLQGLDGNSSDAVFPHTNKHSYLAFLPEVNEFDGLHSFRELLDKILILSPNPLEMPAGSFVERTRPDSKMKYLTDWIRHFSQESFRSYSRLQELLKDGVLEGFHELYLEKTTSTSRRLMFNFSFPENGTDKSFSLSFDQLSDGQRMLVALYTIVCALEEQDYIVCIDEPENFISLREIQPWLKIIEDLVHEKGRQCIMISHHPEMLNYLANEYGTLFYRDESGIVHSKKFECDKELLRPAEIVARGWE